MLYIIDQYGNKITPDPTFRIVGLPLKREYSTTKIPGSDGEKPTSEPVVSSANRSITGLLYATSIEEAENKRRELADFCGRGLIKAGYEGESWHIEGETISFDHKFREDAGRFVAHVSITIKCDDPHQKADEVEEELIITPADYPERIDMSNPHPAANVKLGTFDDSTGAKISDENSWYYAGGLPGASGQGHLSSQNVGNGFSFLSFSDFSLMVYQATVGRKMKIFEYGELIQEIDLAGEPGFVPVEVNFDTRKAREITVVHTEGFMSVDCIIPIPANLPVVTNPGTVADYPVLEVESVDTEAMFSPLGKKVGDDTHPFEIAHFYDSDPLANITPDSAGITPTQAYYDEVAFLDGSTFLPATSTAGRFAVARLKFKAKASQSPYFDMTADEIKNFIQFILSEIWACARGANGGQMVYGIELYCWSGAWTHIAGGDHALDYPKLIQWGNDTGSLPHYINDGKITFLLKPKYPSDGTISSAVWLDHCRLHTVMNYAKMGAEAIVNYGGNLLDNSWREYYATKGYSLTHIFFDRQYTHNGEKKAYPGQKVTLSYEGWRDTEATKNGVHPAILILHNLIDGTYIGYTAPVSLFAAIDANKWVRKITTFKLKDDDNMGSILAAFYRNPNTTLPGSVGIRNAVLVAGDTIIKLQPQELFIIGFSQDVVLIKNNMLSINPKTREINKDGASLYPLINHDFKFSPLQVLGGLNHFKINHTGANLKIRLKYQPKWR